MNTHKKLLTKKTNESGFSMIEVLIALFVVTVGLLGIAALQLTSLRFSHNSHGRSQATFLAADIVERMRANTIQSKTGAYNVTIGSMGSCDGVCSTDLQQWKASLAYLLPAGDGAIEVSGNYLTVTIQWNEQDTPLQQFIYSTSL